MPNYLIGILLEREERRRRLNYRHRLRHLRDVSNPYELPQKKFKKLFRLSKPAVQFILFSFEKLEARSQPTEIPFKIKILCALHFFGHGSYQVSIGSCEIISLSQPSVSRVIKEITKLIVRHLLNDFVKFPQSILELAEVKNKFNQKFQMSGIIGAIDGSHIDLIGPPENDEFFRRNLFRNRKGYHSINTVVCCDANMRILYVNARFPGSVDDSAIWMTSKLRAYLLSKFISVERQRSFLLGDSGFPLEPWLLINFADTENGTIKFRFNEKLIRARNIIEKCFGVLKSRFRCLLRHRTLHYHPRMASQIIYAVCTLHNIHLDRRSGSDDSSDSDGNSDSEEDHDVDENAAETDNFPTYTDSQNDSWYILGSRVRNLYANTHFANSLN